MTIDSHHHLWQYSEAEYPWISDQMSVLKRDFWTTELQDLAAANSIDGFVTVQARQSLEETETLLELADHEPLIRGVVGWVDFRSPHVAGQLDRFASNPKLKGLRHVVQDEPDDTFVLGAEFNRGIQALVGRDLVYDVLIFAKQLEPSIRFVRQHPEIPMVLDHIAKPVISGGTVDPAWANGIREIAALPNISCKFSGVATEVRDSAWNLETIRPYWDIVLEAFTPARLMFGSDWPVCLLRTEYTRWLETVRELASALSDGEQREIFGGSVERAYGLD